MRTPLPDPFRPAAEGIAPDRILQLLLDGNLRYATGRSAAPRRNPIRRQHIAEEQHPLAVVVACSDSRVPPEIILDQGLGDLFIVRLAGNVVGNTGLGSIEYAATHLGARCILVMGHYNCGAIQAAIAGGPTESHVSSIMEALAPAVEEARGQEGDLVENAVRANVRRVCAQLRESEPVLRPLVEEGRVQVYGVVYDLRSGRLTPLDGVP